MMSSLATSSPVSASTLAYLMRWPVLRLIWLKETFSVSDVAGYRATGQVTSERRKKPFQLARGAMGYSENATDDQEGYHPGTGFQADGEGNLQTALTAARPVGCEGRARAVVRAGYGARRSDIAGPKIRNMIRDQALLSGRDAARTYRRFFDPQGSEGTMATREHDQIVETATE